MSAYDGKHFSYTAVQSADSLEEWYFRVAYDFMFFQFLNGIFSVKSCVASCTNYEQ